MMLSSGVFSSLQSEALTVNTILCRVANGNHNLSSMVTTYKKALFKSCVGCLSLLVDVNRFFNLQLNSACYCDCTIFFSPLK